MFRSSLQSGLLSVLYSCGSAPLEHWDMHVKNGYIRRIIDDEVKSLALELSGNNVTTTYIFCPPNPKKVMGISLPFLIMIIKNMKKYFTFEITILDDKNLHRRFRVSNFQSTTRVRPFCTMMPIGLSGGWNQIQFNLADFTRRAYGTNYVETTRMQIHANCRIRRIYFASRLYSDEELPADYKLFLPIHRRKCVREKRSAEKVSKREQPMVEEPPALYKTPAKPDDSIEEKEEVEIPSEAPAPSEEVQPPEVEARTEEDVGEEDFEDAEEQGYEMDERHIYEDEDVTLTAVMEGAEDQEEDEENLDLDEAALEEEG